MSWDWLARDWFDRNGRRAILVQLTFSSRHSLPHNVPLWVDPQNEVYFITITCRHRGRTQLTTPELAGPLLDTVKLRNERSIWFAHIFLLMPDHVHALLSFPPSRNTVQQTVTLWKRWTARQMGIEWQRDFFEHRLRSDESWREKADYILANPVRKGLIAEASTWPYVFLPNPV
jgi:REP element-mobilizing transposase RayT